MVSDISDIFDESDISDKSDISDISDISDWGGGASRPLPKYGGTTGRGTFFLKMTAIFQQK